ncbi:MAG: hypothetical protein AVDCRST_MAG66-2571, partial [uncultured Pseudonocardia sp.]
VLALEPDAARRRLDQPEHGPRRRRLPAARLADERERLPLLQVEGDAVDRPDRAHVVAEDDARPDRI